jgi:hypothetical protein
MKQFEDFKSLSLFDQEIIEIIVSEGETKLEAQLATANAADQRASSFLGFLVGASTATIGAAIALTISDKPRIVLVVIAFAYALCLLVATRKAVQCIRPKLFSYPGNHPENWLSDEWNFSKAKGRTIKLALIEQCYTINQATHKNQKDMVDSANHLKRAIDITFYSTAIAALALFLYSAILLWPQYLCS